MERINYIIIMSMAGLDQQPNEDSFPDLGKCEVSALNGETMVFPVFHNIDEYFPYRPDQPQEWIREISVMKKDFPFVGNLHVRIVGQGEPVLDGSVTVPQYIPPGDIRLPNGEIAKINNLYIYFPTPDTCMIEGFFRDSWDGSARDSIVKLEIDTTHTGAQAFIGLLISDQYSGSRHRELCIVIGDILRRVRNRSQEQHTYFRDINIEQHSENSISLISG